jgi:hypothetical protein
MVFTNILLIVIILGLVVTNRRFDELLNLFHGKNDLYGKEPSVFKILQDLKTRLQDVTSNQIVISHKVDLLADASQADHPAGKESSKNRRRNNLIEIYAQYLIKKEKLSKLDAVIRSKFEVYEFGEDEIIDGIDEDIRLQELLEATARFHTSGLLEKAIKTMERDLLPFDLMEPLYDLVIKQECSKGEKIMFAGNEIWFIEENYHDFVKNRAVVEKLEKIGVIKKINNESWDENPEYILMYSNMDNLRRIIYEGETPHDDDYFEELTTKGELKRLFFNLI